MITATTINELEEREMGKLSERKTKIICRFRKFGHPHCVTAARPNRLNKLFPT